MQKHQARVSLFTSLFNIIHPCGKQIKAQIACFNQWTAPLEEHFFRRSRQAMNDIHLAATSQPVMMAGKVTQAISAPNMRFFLKKIGQATTTYQVFIDFIVVVRYLAHLSPSLQNIWQLQ